MNKCLTEAQKQQALKLLCDTIEIVTVNPNGEEKTLADFIASYLNHSGIIIQVTEFDRGRANIVATIKGENTGKSIIVNGHLDTVPFGNLESWNTPPDKATIKNGVLYGRGSSDMKSGLCAIVYALNKIAEEGFIPQKDIVFIGTGDEETAGLGAQSIVESELLENAGGILIGEPTGNKIAVGSKGTLWLEFTVEGKTSHGAHPWEGLNSAEIAIELYNEVKGLINSEEHPYLTKPTCTLTKILSGVKANMVPDKCEMTLDIRTVPAISHNHLFKTIDNYILTLQKKYKGAKIHYKILTNRMAIEVDKTDELVLQLAQSVEETTGLVAEFTGTGFFSDASIFLKDRYIPTVLFGPGESSEAHKPNESLLIDKYFQSIECYYDFLKKQ